jgi:SNF2 family DNA or RNA helicase
VYVRLDGTLSQPQREKAIKDFSERPEVGVMLISLKAGGVGINLTAASNAFLLVRSLFTFLCLFKMFLNCV